MTALAVSWTQWSARPVMAAPGGRIMGLVAGHGIFAVTGNGSGKTVVVSDPNVSAFAAAPDGLVIAYADSGVGQIDVAAVDGTTSKTITVPTAPGSSIASIAWSPDSSRLAFDYCVSANCGIEISDLAGNFASVWPLSAGGLSPSGGIAWGPKGLVVAMADAGCIPCGGLYSLGVDGLNPQTLLAATAATGYQSPAVSPDGGRVAVTRNVKGQSLFVTSVETLNGTQADLYPRGSYPAWSPDGTALAYTNGYQLFAGDSGGGGSELLTSFPFYGVSDLSWVPWPAAPPGGCAVALSPGVTEGITSDATGHGYWVTDAYGTVSACGDAAEHGGIGGATLNQPVVGIASTIDHGGYWLAAYDGGVFSFGDAASLPLAGSPGRISLSGLQLSAPIYGVAADPVAPGLWLVATDGGVFTFGKAPFYGSAGGIHLAAPIVGMAATPDGGGYWLLGRDGGVFSYGDATYAGGAVGRLSAPAVAIVACPKGGYWLVEADGSVLSFGGAPAMTKATFASRIVSASATPTGAGMWVVATDGTVAALGDAASVGSAG